MKQKSNKEKYNTEKKGMANRPSLNGQKDLHNGQTGEGFTIYP